MDIRKAAINEYLNEGIGYRKLAAKYGISRTVINKWVMMHQEMHNIPRTEKQQKYYLPSMKSDSPKNNNEEEKNAGDLQQRIELLEKQLAWEKLRADALDTMITIAEKQLNIPIRKKSGTQQSQK